MKKSAALFFALFSLLSVQAQYYTIAQSTGAPGDFNINLTPHDTLIYEYNFDTLTDWKPLPFPFEFYGDTMYAYKASDNGYITFDSTTTSSYPNNDLPPTAAGPNNAIYAFWEDLVITPNVGAKDIVKAWTYGTAPNRVHAVQWYSTTPNGTGDYLYCTVLLQECGGFQVMQNWSNSIGRSGTVGCENKDGTQASIVTGSPNLAAPTNGSANADDIVYTFNRANIANEAGIFAITSPAAIGPVAYTVEAEITNGGSNTLTTLFLSYSVNGGSPVTSALTPNIATQSSATIAHPIAWNPPGPGIYSLCVWSTLPNGQADPIACNDTLCMTVEVASFNPGCGTVKIVVLGSSTAAGAGPSTQDSAWVWRYRNYLTGLNPGNQVINYAIGGTTTYHIMPDNFVPPSGRPNPNPAMNITLALAQNPDAIIINMPSNDAATGVDSSETIANFDSLYAMGTRAGVTMYICTTQPRNFSSSALIANQVAVKNYVLATFAPYALDFWNPFATTGGTIAPQYDSGDGVHMNDPAHRNLFEKVRDIGVAEEILFPAADFGLTNIGNNYTFSDQSDNATAWYWDFGDGNLDSTANPTHSYATGGNFTVCLIAENGCARDTVCQSINVCLPPVASLTSQDQGNRRFDFTANPGTGVAFHWDFGDGTFSSLPNPIHIYSADGTFTVCLTYTDSCASDTVCETITVCQAPIAFFTYNTPLPYQVDFSDASQHTTGWAWDFGDGNTDTQQNPSHTYSVAGTYSVQLIATNGCDTDTLSNTVTILPSGFAEMSDIQVEFFPNPNNGSATLKGLSGPSWIRVVNATGQDVTSSVRIERNGSDSYRLKGRKLAAGLYLIEVQQGENSTSLRWKIDR